MWKESYRIGVDLIDRQHMELFKMVGHLVDVVQNNDEYKKEECMIAISYMKDYTLRHFKDEEDYQQSIRHPDFEEHRDVHKKFAKTILNYEKRMIQSDFDEMLIKDFMGTLIAWLVYHVAGTDQQITEVKKHRAVRRRKLPINRYFNMSARDVMNKLIGQDITDSDAKKAKIDDLQSAIVVIMHLNGGELGKVTFKYTRQLAFELIKSMAFFTPKSIDEIVRSAMLEISNIISVRAAGMMVTNGFLCDIGDPVIQVHPVFLTSDKGVIFDTGIGALEIAVS